MRLIFAAIVAAATLSTLATPVFADGERGRDQHDDRGRGNHDNNRGNGHYSAMTEPMIGAIGNAVRTAAIIATLIIVVPVIGGHRADSGRIGTIAGAIRTAMPANGALTAMIIIAAGNAAILGTPILANGAIGAAGAGLSQLAMAALGTVMATSMAAIITINKTPIARSIVPKIGSMAVAR